jgi:hypothetical protein
MFAVGKLEEFDPRILHASEVVDKLHSTECFRTINNSFVQKLKDNYITFVSRVDAAINSGDESYWHTLCNEPKTKLKSLWKIKKEVGKGPKSDVQKREESEKNLMQAMYYCLYVVLFWRHEGSYERYKHYYQSLEDFQFNYEHDVCFPRDRMDKWETLHCFRNVMLLAAAVKPSMRNKGLFTKLGCILAEDRIHTMGGGQSFAADRRGYIYDKEGNAFATGIGAMSSVDVDFSSVPQAKSYSDRLTVKCKRVCPPPSLSRGGSQTYRYSKHSKNGLHDVDVLSASRVTEFPVTYDIDSGGIGMVPFADDGVSMSLTGLTSEVSLSIDIYEAPQSASSVGDTAAPLNGVDELIVSDVDMCTSEFLRNLSLNHLSEMINSKDSDDSDDTESLITSTTLPPDAASVDFHRSFVVDRAFSYNAYILDNRDTSCGEIPVNAAESINLSNSYPVYEATDTSNLHQQREVSNSMPLNDNLLVDCRELGYVQ